MILRYGDPEDPLVVAVTHLALRKQTQFSQIRYLVDVLADARRFISASVPVLPLMAHLPSKIGLARHRVHSLTVPHPAAIGR